MRSLVPSRNRECERRAEREDFCHLPVFFTASDPRDCQGAMLIYGGERATGQILIRSARQLLTLRGPRGPRRGANLNDLGIIADGAVLIQNGVLQEVGPTRRLENLAGARNAIEINAAGRVVMPGFVDCHTHLVFPWGQPRSGRHAVRCVDIHNGTGAICWRPGAAHLEAMARYGTTTVEVKTGCGTDETAETEVLRAFTGFKGDPVDVFATVLFCRPGSHELDGAHDAATWTGLRSCCRKTGVAVGAIRGSGMERQSAWYARCSLQYLQAARNLGFYRKIQPTACAGLRSI